MLMRENYRRDRAGEAMAGKGSPQTPAKVTAMRAQDSNALRLRVLGRDGGQKEKWRGTMKLDG